MRSATALRRRSFLEGLEARQVLSGVVGTELVDGTLTITGDDASNQIAIYAGAAGEVIVAGGADEESETLVDDLSEPVTFTGVTNIELEMAGGDDTVVVTNLELAGNVTADLGDGNDQLIVQGTSSDEDETDEDDDDSLIDLNGDEELELGEVVIAGDVTVTGGAGNDLAAVSSASIEGDVSFEGEAGKDVFRASDATLGGAVDLTMGAGDDSVAIGGSEIAGDLTVDDSEAVKKGRVALRDTTVAGDVSLTLADKADQVIIRDLTVGDEVGGGAVSIDTAGGNDGVNIRALTAAELSVLTGAGRDRVRIGASDIAGDLDVDVGEGKGSIAIANSTADALSVLATGAEHGVGVRLSNVEAVDAVLTLGDGNDQLSIRGSDFETLAADLAGGKDRLMLLRNNVTTSTNLDGGDGKDRLLKLKGNTLASLTDADFETKIPKV